MNTVDTLTLDSTRWAAWTSNPDYDYGRELVQNERTLLEQLSQAFNDWLSSIFNGALSDIAPAVWWVIAGVIIVALALVIVQRNPELFGRRNKQLEDSEDTEDTIYGVDFEDDIRKATAAGNWREAVRLTYLHALRILHDSGRIDWQPYKTPTQYTREVTTAEFRTMTNHFLRIRYGGFAASEALLHTMQELFAQVTTPQQTDDQTPSSTGFGPQSVGDHTPSPTGSAPQQNGFAQQKGGEA